MMLRYKEAVCVDRGQQCMLMGQIMWNNVILAKTDNMLIKLE